MNEHLRWDSHCHLEGSIYPETWAVMRQANLAPQGLWPATPEPPHDFSSFFATLRHGYEIFGWPTVYPAVLEGLAARLNAGGVRYGEVQVNLALLAAKGHTVERIFTLLGERAEQVERNMGVRVRFVGDLPWQFDPALFDPFIEEPEAFRKLGVVGLSMGGKEKHADPSRFSKTLERARAAGYAVMSHCGEGGDPGMVREVLKRLPVNRVAHAVAGATKPDVVLELADRGIGVDVCFSSNRFLLGIEPVDHPFRKFLDGGVTLGFGTDDPALLQVDPASEWGIVETLVEPAELETLLGRSLRELALDPAG